MPLHLNLYHEIHYQAHQRARDPFKLASFAGLALALIFVGYYFYRAASVSGLEKEFSTLKQEWRTLEPKMNQAKKRFNELVGLEKVNAALNQRIQGRLYFAPILTRMAEVVPPHIQIRHFTARYDQAARKVSLTFDGLAASEQPRGAAEEFRRGLKEAFSTDFTNVSAEFHANSLEDVPGSVELQGQALPMVRFQIRVEMLVPAETDSKE